MESAAVGRRVLTERLGWEDGALAAHREEIIELGLRHLVEPVLFRLLIERLYHDAGARIFVQVGIGSLTGFVEDTLADVDHASMQVLTTRRSALAQMHRAMIESHLVPEGHDLRVTLSTLNWLAAAIVADDGRYRDIEAREVPEGASAEAIAKPPKP